MDLRNRIILFTAQLICPFFFHRQKADCLMISQVSYGKYLTEEAAYMFNNRSILM